jgi:hypothetical protein
LVADFLKKRENTPQNQFRSFEMRRMPNAGKNDQAGTVDISSQALALGQRDEFVFATGLGIKVRFCGSTHQTAEKPGVFPLSGCEAIPPILTRPSRESRRSLTGASP